MRYEIGGSRVGAASSRAALGVGAASRAALLGKRASARHKGLPRARLGSRGLLPQEEQRLLAAVPRLRQPAVAVGDLDDVLEAQPLHALVQQPARQPGVVVEAVREGPVLVEL